MFGWFKRNAVAEMKNIIYLAQLSSYFLILETLCLTSNTIYKDQENPEVIKNSSFAAAVTNHLFAKTMANQHKNTFTAVEIEAWADNWLDTKSEFCELTIQCLRALNTIQFSNDKKATEVLGENYLTKYGQKYPLSPNPDLLKSLVSKVTCLLSPDYRNTISSEAKRLNIKL